ncbi:MAG: hypothetical protein ABH811_01940 [archaeon]
MKKGKIGVCVLFLSIFLSVGLVSADSCTIKNSCVLGEYAVLGMSALTNAHGELASQENYDYVLCCDFGSGDTTCTGSNKIMGLSALTNAHAEIPTLNNYDSDVCYEGVSCISGSGCTAEYPEEILSLSASTNAHLGTFSNYPVKICCNFEGSTECVTDEDCPEGYTCPDGNCISLLGEYYWASPNNLDLSITFPYTIDPGKTTLAMVFLNAGSPGSELTFEIYEDDLIVDDEIRVGTNAIPGQIDQENRGIGQWTVTEEDLGKTSDKEEFVFLVTSNPTKFSPPLRLIIDDGMCVDIDYCSDYTEEIMCNLDPCNRHEASVERIAPAGVTCGDDYECQCEWREGECKPGWTPKGEDPDYPDDPDAPKRGTCVYEESTNDNCEDGYLTFSWDIDIDWPEDGSNDGWSNKLGCTNAGGTNNGCVEFLKSIEPNFDNLWHYDVGMSVKNPLLTQCHGGSKTIQCSAQMQLNFFGFYNLIVIFTLIFLVYIFLIFKREK